jgi:putative FmdB family regulatory protein
MPRYEYICDKCGSFSEDRPLAEYSEPCPCPVCGQSAPRNSISTPLFFSKGSARTVLRAEAHSKRYGFVACQCCRK